MPGKSYNNPQLEYQKNIKDREEAAKRQKAEAEKKKQQEKDKKKVANLKDQISKNNKQITAETTKIKNAEISKAGYVKEYNKLVRDSKSPSSPGGTTQTVGELAAIDAMQGNVTRMETTISTAKTKVQNLKTSNDALTKQFNSLTNIKSQKDFSSKKDRVTTTSSTTTGGGNTGGSGTGGNQRKGEEEKPKGPYKYNLPLIKPARFSTDSNSPLITSMGDASNLVGVPGFSTVNAENYWKEKPGRGVLRVNREWMKSILNSSDYENGNLDKLKDGTVSSRKPDKRLYGFRFLYNPEKIQMVYDINADLHPGLLATGKDVFLPLTKSSSALSMDLVLNRMEDMKYRSNPRLAIKNQVYYGGGETEGLLSDVQEVHEKGTMYDMEYLFKTLNAPNATFTSQYNGETADMGFIRPSILELHLGNRLRYPVRVVSLAIEHKIFDPRMVPIFSIVRITFARFIEFQTNNDKGSSSSTIATGGGGGGRYKVQ